MANLNNNAIYTVVRAAYSQALGDAAVDTVDLSDFVDKGAAYSDLVTYKEQFTGALINVLAKNWFLDSSYRTQFKDMFFEDERKFGAIVQAISIEAPAVQESHAWQTFTSGTSTAGQYTLFLPVVETQYYAKTVSWELPIAITYEQWDDAFRSESALSEFVAYVLMVVDNALVVHLENMNNANRNNFIAEKVAYAASQGATGIHKINLVEAYGNANIKTAKAFMADADALRWAAGEINLYSKYIGKMNTLFNTEGKARFVPEERKVLQVLSVFEKALNTVSYANTFHDEFVKLGNGENYESVPYWQGFGTDADFDTVSKIKVETSSGAQITQSGVVAFLADKWAIVHTIKSHRIAVKDFNPEAVTQYFYQYRDAYMNNLTMPAIVFTLEDVSA